MTKAELRKLYREKRSAISSKEKLKLDELLLIQFQKLPLSDIQTLCTYWPTEKFAEPNTHLFSGYLRHTIPSLIISYPVINVASLSIQAVSIDETTTYKHNAYGIYEPVNAKAIDEEDMLVCDEQGNRVGFGKGYYDRFLSNCRKDVISIGFSYFKPVDAITDNQPFDIPLNYCITPEAVYEF